MFHFFEAITNTSGESLIGYFARVIDTGTSATVTLASDDNGTPISTVSGVANMGKTDEQGNLSFYVQPGTYHLDLYAPNATSFIRRVPNVGMNSTKGDQGDAGPPGPADAFRPTLAALKAADITDGKSDYDGSTWFWTLGDFSAATDLNANTVKATSTALTVGAWVRQRADGITFKAKPSATRVRNHQEKSRDVLSAQDFPGVAADGVTDDTAGLTQAAAVAVVFGRVLDMRGMFAVSNWKLPGVSAGVSQYLSVIGEPVFVQATSNTPCLSIQDATLQQSCGHKFACTVVPHPASSKSNAANMAVNLTGFSNSEITVTLGAASSHDNNLGRFHTVVYADSASPFFYGNAVRVIANSVPSPKYVLRLGNRGTGAGGNPNVNTFSAWCVSLDTVAGDVLLDLGNSTLSMVRGPTLLEACPAAVGIKCGNASDIEGVWFELIGVDLDITGSGGSITPNNCKVRNCTFSGAGHVVKIANGLGAPPLFEHNVNDDVNISFVDETGASIAKPRFVRGRAQPSAPSLSIVAGVSATLTPDQSSARLLVDHHGRTVFQLRLLAAPSATGATIARIGPPTGYEVESAVFGVKDGTTNLMLPWGLSDALNGADYQWSWNSTNQHIINARITLCAL